MFCIEVARYLSNIVPAETLFIFLLKNYHKKIEEERRAFLRLIKFIGDICKSTYVRDCIGNNQSAFSMHAFTYLCMYLQSTYFLGL